MTVRTLLDTGPLVAFLNRRDRYHAWALAQLAELPAPLLTCEAVLSEACFLLRHLPGGGRAVIELVTRGVLKIGFRLEEDAASVGRLLGRYASVPMSLADACLVRLVEKDSGSRLLTLDRDFRVYRAHGRQVIPLTIPSDL